jgi:splicing factor 1
VCLKVALPPALTGAPISDDPHIRELHEELNEVSRKILNNELDIPPEGERSPSPEPVYDRMGIRLNTREVRVKDRLLERRSYLIEELIKSDPTYRPPADYRPAKKHRKIFIPLRVGPSGLTNCLSHLHSRERFHRCCLHHLASFLSAGVECYVR